MIRDLCVKRPLHYHYDHRPKLPMSTSRGGLAESIHVSRLKQIVKCNEQCPHFIETKWTSLNTIKPMMLLFSMPEKCRQTRKLTNTSTQQDGMCLNFTNHLKFQYSSNAQKIQCPTNNSKMKEDEQSTKFGIHHAPKMVPVIIKIGKPQNPYLFLIVWSVAQ